jgi:phenylacetate-CoA ligase
MPPHSSEVATFENRYNAIDSAYRSGTLTREGLDAWRRAQLKTVLTHVKVKSPFYARTLVDIDPETIDIANLESLPFTTKDDLRTEMFEILSGSLNDAIYYYETTGTTGLATPCPRSKHESYASNRQLLHAYRDVMAAHFPPGHQPVVAVLGPTEAHSFTDTLGSIAYELDLCVAKIWPGSPIIGFDKCLNLIRDLGVEVIATAPGQVMTLAKEAHKRGLDPRRDFNIKLFMLSGEVCTPELAENLESLWGARVFNSLYGSQEAFVVASTTPENTMRPHLPNYIFEIVDPNTGTYLGDSGHGELVVTCLVDGIKPLVRYRTGDIVHLRDSGSSNLFEAFEIEIVGRVKDTVLLNGYHFTAAQVEAALMKHVRGCVGYQIMIGRSHEADNIVVKLELPDVSIERRKAMMRLVEHNVGDVLGCACTVLVVDDLSDHVNMGGWIKWKSARLVDSRDPMSEADDASELTTATLLSRLKQ